MTLESLAFKVCTFFNEANVRPRRATTDRPYPVDTSRPQFSKSVSIVGERVLEGAGSDLFALNVVTAGP